MQRLWRGIAVAAIALIVAGCGGDDDTTTEATPSASAPATSQAAPTSSEAAPASDAPATAESSTAETTAAAETTAEESGDPVTLTLWDRDILKEEWAKQIIDEYQQAHPNVTIEYVKQPSDIAQADQAFKAAGIAKNGPDIATLYAGGMVNSFADFLEPMDDHFSEEEIAKLSGWDTVRRGFASDGELLAVPFGAGLYFDVFCNTANLQKAGVTLDTPPQTWEAFLDVLQTVKDGGQLPLMIGNQEGYTGAWVMGALVGGQIGTAGFFEMLAGDRPVDDPAMVTAYQKYAELYSRGLTNEDAGALTNGDGEKKFFAGKGACFISGDWQDQLLIENLGEGNVITFPLPVLEGSTRLGARTGGTASAIAVTNYSDAKDAAIEFVKFLVSKESLDSYVKTNQIEPSNHAEADSSVIANPLLREQADQTAAASAQGEDFLIFPFDSIMPQEVNDLFYRMNAAVLTGQEQPQSAVDKLQQAYDDWKEQQI